MDRWTEVVLSSFAGSRAGFTVGGDVDYAAAARCFANAASDKARLGFRLAVLLAMSAPLWMWGRLSTLAGLACEERSRVMDELLRHRVFFVRELSLLLKLVACMAIFRSADARARSGFDKPRSLPLAVHPNAEEAA